MFEKLEVGQRVRFTLKGMGYLCKVEEIKEEEGRFGRFFGTFSALFDRVEDEEGEYKGGTIFTLLEKADRTIQDTKSESEVTFSLPAPEDV